MFKQSVFWTCHGSHKAESMTIDELEWKKNKQLNNTRNK